MGKIHRLEILPLEDYEEIRPRFRGRVVQEKRSRRIHLGPHISAVFENRDSVLLQIQEMLRTERIVSEEGIAHEVETYNELLPAEDELSLTLFVEIADKDLRERTLVELAGLEDQIILTVDGHDVRASGRREEAELGAESTGRTTAVHYLKFKLPPEVLPAIQAAKAKMEVGIRHPKYPHSAALTPKTRKSLAADWL